MFRIIAVGLTGLILAACDPVEPPAAPAAPAEPAAAPESDAPMETAPSDPLEAIEWRADRCAHYSGEIAGDQSERDRWLQEQMGVLRCDELVAEARAMREARADEPAVAARLDEVIALFEY